MLLKLIAGALLALLAGHAVAQSPIAHVLDAPTAALAPTHEEVGR
jgi:hypothetical protein